MIIYHGSTVLIEKPEIRISDSFLDFGLVLGCGRIKACSEIKE